MLPSLVDISFESTPFEGEDVPDLVAAFTDRDLVDEDDFAEHASFPDFEGEDVPDLEAAFTDRDLVDEDNLDELSSFPSFE